MSSMMGLSLFFVLFTCLTGGLGALFSVFSSGLTVTDSWWAIGMALPLALLAVQRQKKRTDFKLPVVGVFDYLMVFCFCLFCFRQFAWLFYLRDGNYLTLDISNYGDLPLHLTFIEQIARGVKLLALNPIFPYERLHYPVGVDFVAACFLKLGLSLEQILSAMGLLLSFSLVWILLAWGRGFTVGAFLFSGGLGGFEIFSSHVLKDYQATMAWKNILLTLLVPQRGFLIGFSAGLWLLWSWRQKFFLKKAGLSYFIESVLYGTMPFFHFHTFIFLSLVLAIMAFSCREMKTALKTVTLSFLPATYFTLIVTDFFRQSSIIWIESGWLIKGQNIVTFFLQNYGLFFPLAFLSGFVALRDRRFHGLVFLFAGLLIFGICLIVMFAPWDWDNTKLMVWSYILILPVIDELVILRQPWFGRIVIYFVFYFSGALALWSGYVPSNQGYNVASLSEYEPVCLAVKALDPTLIFATAPTFGHPVSLCGSPIVAGYEGHLWSYGIKSKKTIGLLKQFMLGQDNYKKLADELQIRYVFWGSREEKEYSGSSLTEQIADKVIAEGGWGRIFDLRKIK